MWNWGIGEHLWCFKHHLYLTQLQMSLLIWFGSEMVTTQDVAALSAFDSGLKRSRCPDNMFFYCYDVWSHRIPSVDMKSKESLTNTPIRRTGTSTCRLCISIHFQSQSEPRVNTAVVLYISSNIEVSADQQSLSPVPKCFTETSAMFFFPAVEKPVFR